jgi:hypothetical protein
MVVDDDVESIGTEEIGSVRRIEPTALKWKQNLPKVTSSHSLKEAKNGCMASGCGMYATDSKRIDSPRTNKL